MVAAVSGRPLVGTPDEEFASEARIVGSHARDMMNDGSWSRGKADAEIYRDAHRLASVYGLSVVRFIELADAASRGNT